MDLEAKLYREGFVVSSKQRRFGAYVVDKMIISLLVFGYFFDQFGDDFIQNLKTTVVLVAVFGCLEVLYNTAFISVYGKSVGKMVFRIRVVDIYLFDNPTLQSAFFRSCVKIGSEIMFGLGILYIYNNNLNQTFYDEISKVVNIDE